VEHIQPIVKGGNSDPENLAWACPGCNGAKYIATHATDPLTETLVPLYHPRTQGWYDHFRWSEDFLYVIGITPTGRATEAKLNMNREGLVNLRELLYRYGKHPPF
jgi:HNH endonuclease